MENRTDQLLQENEALKRQVADLEASLAASQQREAALTSRIKVLREIDLEILAASSPRDIAQVAINHLYQILPGQLVSMSIFDELNDRAALINGDEADSPAFRKGDLIHPEIHEVEMVVLQKGRISTIKLPDQPEPNPRIRQENADPFIMRIPLIAQDELIGSINVSGPNLDQVTGDHRAMLLQTADQLSIAIQQTRLHEKTRRQLGELTLLHRVAIAGVQSESIDGFLHRATQVLNETFYTDSFAIGLVDEDTQILRFYTPDNDGLAYPYLTEIPLGKGVANRVMTSGSALRIADVRKESEYIGSNPHIRSELCVPLKIGGQSVGVLNAESNRIDAFTPDDERFLITVAGQIGSAIEKGQLLNDLRQSNIEISQAYDTTLEGWAKALELRDNETEGHCQRVTNLTVGLAIEMGIGEEELIHVYRGSLLHDIGKMGIPDRILRKPGPLTEEEWEIMRQHPVIALELLSSIPFLRPALDIPYYHHERWDGSGYPRGLKGEEIPLVARIFAVVDVWDSLVSERPYSPAWPHAEACEYIAAQSGLMFDPEVVKTFFRVLDNWVF